MPPKISIITISLNDYVGLQETIRSVDANLISGVEHVIKDGASTDGTVEMLQSLPQIAARRWISTPDAGIYAGMNEGLREAVGEYVLMLNSGDTLKDGSVARWLTYLGDHPETDLICSNLRWNRLDGTALYLSPPMSVRNPTLMPVWHQAALIRKSLHERFGFYRADYKMISDMIFYQKVFQYTNNVHLDFVSSVMGAGGISETRRWEQMKEFLRYLKEIDAPMKEYLRTILKFSPLAPCLPWIRSALQGSVKMVRGL